MKELNNFHKYGWITMIAWNLLLVILMLIVSTIRKVPFTYIFDDGMSGVGISLFLLPIMMGLWLMYHSFMIISLGGDMSTIKVPGDGMVIVGGILLLLLSVFVIVDPFSVGVATVLTVAGAGLIFLGVIMCSLSLTLRSIGKEESV